MAAHKLSLDSEVGASSKVYRAEAIESSFGHVTEPAEPSGTPFLRRPQYRILYLWQLSKACVLLVRIRLRTGL